MTHILGKTDPIVTYVEMPKIDSGCFLEKEFIELIHMSP